MQSLPIVSHDSPICLIGGARISNGAFSAVKTHVATFVAVDSGADFLLAQGEVPAAVIGDLDSISNAARAAFADRLCHISEQSTTDFEKALTRIVAPSVIGLGFTGGRLDHVLSVLNTMARHAHRAVVLLDENDTSFVAVAGTTRLHLAQGTRISVMPIGSASSVSLSGVVWPFADQVMTLDGFTSPSNAAAGGEVTLTTSDPVLITLPREQLAAALTAAVREG